MSNGPTLALFVIGFAVCMGVGVLMIVAFGICIYYFGKNTVGPMRQRQLESIVENWAERQEYRLLDVRDIRSRDHPFADRFGFGFGKVAGVVKRIEVKDQDGYVRRGWVFVRARLGPQGTYSGFQPDSLEVAWDDHRDVIP